MAEGLPTGRKYAQSVAERFGKCAYSGQRKKQKEKKGEMREAEKHRNRSDLQRRARDATPRPMSMIKRMIPLTVHLRQADESSFNPRSGILKFYLRIKREKMRG